MFHFPWLRLPQRRSSPPPSHPRATQPAGSCRPCLELLEDRLTPGTFNTTTAVLSVSPATFTPFSQTETVTTQTTFVMGGAVLPVPGGLVRISDGSQSKLVPIDPHTGKASATFTFNLLQGQEQPNAHAVSASFGQFMSPAGDTFMQSTASGQAPASTTPFLFQILLDLAFLQAAGI